LAIAISLFLKPGKPKRSAVPRAALPLASIRLLQKVRFLQMTGGDAFHRRAIIARASQHRHVVAEPHKTSRSHPPKDLEWALLPRSAIKPVGKRQDFGEGRLRSGKIVNPLL